ncbi:MAG: glutathione S-transferase family protein [Gammaproteobacteria bacterium]|nr:glutathione S-transferase family protein [Gammaproteobacteria bacterium]
MAEFTLIIGNKNYSSWSLRPWLWMKHLGIEFDEIIVPLYQPETNEKLSVYFSNDKVPVLLHNNFEVWDSLSICEYVAELFPQNLYWDPKHKAVMRSLCAEMHSSFASLRSELPMNCGRQPSPLAVSDACQADINRIQDLWRHAAKYSDEKAGWLFGSFSIADAMFAPVALRFHLYAIPLDKPAGDYVERLLRHPAMLEWVAAGQAESWIIESEER